MAKLEEIKNYFKSKYLQYDLVEKQLYWILSDRLLWFLLRKVVLNKFKKRKIKFLDAGGGTGRWSIKILEYLPNSTCVLYDISKEMLSIAKEKLVKKNLLDRVSILNGNLENMGDIKDSEYDLVINFHNVLGFLENPEKGLSKMFRVLKLGGHLISVVPNLYHNIYFNLQTGRLKELDKTVRTHKGKFTDDMPNLYLFTPTAIRRMYKELGLNDIKIFGFPVTIYPHKEETKTVGDSEKISNILSNKRYFKQIEKIEKILILNGDATGRGNNLFVVGRKQLSKLNPL